MTKLRAFIVIVLAILMALVGSIHPVPVSIVLGLLCIACMVGLVRFDETD